jgi:hypothetical protein
MFAFEPKNMVCHIFGRKRSEAKRPAERGRRSKSAERGRGFKWRAPTRSVGRRPFKPQTALLSAGRPWVRSESGVCQTRYRSDFKRTWVRLAKEEGETALGLDGEKVFSPAISPKKGRFDKRNHPCAEVLAKLSLTQCNLQSFSWQSISQAKSCRNSVRS